MLTKEIKQRIDRARDILVGQLPLPSDQIELITIAMIYKFMDDMDEDARSLGGVPAFFIDDLRPFAWPALLSNQLSSADRVLRFTQAIEHLQKAQHIPALFRSIFQNTFLKFRDGRILKMFLDEINGFTYDNSEDLGNAFEYLLMSMGTQAENGQFRTPRHLIDFVVEVVEPELTDSILDPACGTAGFLISAFQYLIRLHTRGLEDYRVSLGNRTDAELARVKRGDKLRPEDRDKKGLNPVGYDITPMMVRLSRVNLYLHRVANPQIHEYDTLSNDHRWTDKFDCILANPPFMTPTGGVQPHSRFRLKANKAEVLFADYILEHLDPYRGKAGIVVPEGIIFQNSRDYVQLRRWLVEEAGLWAVVSLPAHVFQPYSGVKTSILLIDKELTRTGSPTAERTRAGANILLVKIDNDGYSLNTNRTPVAANDLPAAYQLLHAWKHDQPLPADASVAHRVVPRADFARLDPYRAATTALDAVRKPFRTLIKPGSEAARQRRIAAFCESVGLDHLPASEADLKAWFDEHLRAAAVAYGAGDEAAELPEELKTAVRDAREYSLSFERYATKLVVEPGANNYPIVQLHEVCTIDPRRNKLPEDLETLVSFLPMSDVQSNHPDIHPVQTRPLGEVIKGYTNFQRNDILIAKITPCFQNRKMGVVHDVVNNIGFGSTEYYVLRCGETVLPKYVFHWLANSDFVERGTRNMSGSAGQQRVTKEYVSSFSIPLPPLAVQQQLVTQIETYQKVVDGCTAVIEGYEPEIITDAGWPVVLLKEVSLPYSTTDPLKYPSREINYIDIGGIDNTAQAIATTTKLLGKDAPSRARKLVQPGDTIFSTTRPYLRNIAFIDQNYDGYVCSTGFAVLRPDTDVILPRFLFFTAVANAFVNAVNAKAGGAAYPAVNESDLMSMPIAVPPLDEQIKILHALEAEMTAVEGCRQLRTKMQARIQRVLGQVWQQEATVPVEVEDSYTPVR